MDFSVLSPMQKGTLRGLLEDKEQLHKINIALQEQFKKMKGAHTLDLGDIKTHLESLLQWKALFENANGEVDVSIIIRKIL